MIAPAFAEPANQRAGLLAVHRLERLGVEWRRRLSRPIGCDRGEIDRLSAHHADRARRTGDRLDDTKLARDEIRVGRARLTRQHVKRFSQQPVAGKDRHPLAGDDVQRRPSSSHDVIVHRGEVVVNQRVGVDQFDGARRGHGE